MSDARQYAAWSDLWSRSRSWVLESHSRGVDHQSRMGLMTNFFCNFLVILRCSSYGNLVIVPLLFIYSISCCLVNWIIVQFYICHSSPLHIKVRFYALCLTTLLTVQVLTLLIFVVMCDCIIHKCISDFLFDIYFSVSIWDTFWTHFVFLMQLSNVQ